MRVRFSTASGTSGSSTSVTLYVIPKLLTISSNWASMLSAVEWPLNRLQASIALYSIHFEIRLAVMPIQLRICRLDQISTVNESSFASLSFLTNMCWISVAMSVISVVERCFRLGMITLASTACIMSLNSFASTTERDCSVPANRSYSVGKANLSWITCCKLLRCNATKTGQSELIRVRYQFILFRWF